MLSREISYSQASAELASTLNDVEDNHRSAQGDSEPLASIRALAGELGFGEAEQVQATE